VSFQLVEFIYLPSAGFLGSTGAGGGGAGLGSGKGVKYINYKSIVFHIGKMIGQMIGEHI
jgi:hypothetical protein